ncbi:MAG: type II secretion system F family protein [Alphaproteobacteria bacterium]|nr:type II secretion system F family protein [Alphaproteobacteria bacterium]MBO4643549.1 type II secretion system F family protein [Alphaproteobacteria bacterium]
MADRFSLAELNRYYAMIICRMSHGTRIKIYRKLISLLRNRFSLMDALDRIRGIITNEGRNPDEPMALAVLYWTRSLQNGNPFSVALEGWAPASERLMLSVGDVSHLEGALENLIKVTEGTKKMKEPLISAISYPMFLSMMVVLIIYAIGAYMVPPMMNAAPNTRWTGSAKDLVSLSVWIQKNWAIAFASLPTLFVIIYLTMGRWKGKTRAFFENIPPWSLYRIFVGVTWLLAMAALVRAGTPVSQALRSLRHDASPYLLYRIDSALVYVNNGDNLGEALMKTGLGFPDKEIVGDLRIYSEMDNFQEALDQMANEWLEDSVSSIEKKASVLNMIATLFVSGTIAWAVMGTFAMQDQITKAMG